jgi:hypothetical protein
MLRFIIADAGVSQDWRMDAHSAGATEKDIIILKSQYPQRKFLQSNSKKE